MLGEPQKQFSLTREALSPCRAQKQVLMTCATANFRSVGQQALALLAPLFLVACAAPRITYPYGNQTFPSPDKALAKQAAENSEVLAAITPASDPVRGKALVVLPSREDLRKHYVRIWLHVRVPQAEDFEHDTVGSAYSDLRTDGVLHDDFEYASALLENDQEMLVAALRKRQLFDQLTVTHANDPIAVAMTDNNFLIFLDVDGWFIRTQRSAPRRITTDGGSAPSLSRTQSFLASVEEWAHTLPQ